MSNLLNKKEHKAFVAELAAALKEHSEVRVSGLGKFVVKDMAARKARNPKTGEEITIPARKKLVCRFGKPFKEAVLE